MNLLNANTNIISAKEDIPISTLLEKIRDRYYANPKKEDDYEKQFNQFWNEFDTT